MANHVLHPSPKAKVSPGVKSLPLYGQEQISQHSPSGAVNTLALASQVGHVISLYGKIMNTYVKWVYMYKYVCMSNQTKSNYNQSQYQEEYKRSNCWESNPARTAGYGHQCSATELQLPKQ